MKKRNFKKLTIKKVTISLLFGGTGYPTREPTYETINPLCTSCSCNEPCEVPNQEN